MKLELIGSTQNPDEVIALAGKLCYSKVGVDDLKDKLTQEDIEKFLTMLMNIGHESPLEHASFTFALEGVSRALTHQLVRHRIASFSQQSQRYVKLDQFEYIIPPKINRNKKAREMYISTMEADQLAYDYIYDELLIDEAKWHPIYGEYLIYARETLKEEYKEVIVGDIDIRILHEYDKLETLDQFWMRKNKQQYLKVQKTIIEDCRYVFPNSCETKIILTMNLRSVINFVSHRKCRRAQWEIRQVAEEMEKIISEKYPILAKGLGAPCQFGSCPEGKMSCGVKYERKNS